MHPRTRAPIRAKVNLADIKGLRAQFKRDLAQQWTHVEDASVRKMLMETSGFDMTYLEKVPSTPLTLFPRPTPPPPRGSPYKY